MQCLLKPSEGPIIEYMHYVLPCMVAIATVKLLGVMVGNTFKRNLHLVLCSCASIGCHSHTISHLAQINSHQSNRQCYCPTLTNTTPPPPPPPHTHTHYRHHQLHVCQDKAPCSGQDQPARHPLQHRFGVPPVLPEPAGLKWLRQ